MKEEVYTVLNKHDGVEYTFFTSAMVRFATELELPTRNVEISMQAIQGILNGDTIEQAKLLKTELSDARPIVIVEWAPGQGHSIVDGNHRVILKHLHGIHTHKAWVWPFGAWEPFSMTGRDIEVLFVKMVELGISTGTDCWEGLWLNSP